MNRRTIAAGIALLMAPALTAQQMPATQPAMISITREIEKPGHFAVHEAVETRWAALSRRYNFPYNYLALVANSGVQEVWWVTAYDGLGSFGKGVSFGTDNPAYMQALSRIAVEDGEHLNNVIMTQARAVPEASYGAFPEMAKMRVFSVFTVQMRLGMEQAFPELAKKYAGFMQAKSVATSWRTYEAIAGAPGGTFMVFSSYPSWEAAEANQKASDAAMMATAAAELEAFTKTWRESVVSANVRYFTVNPNMSVVSKEVAAADPFWTPKQAAAPKKATP